MCLTNPAECPCTRCIVDRREAIPKVSAPVKDQKRYIVTVTYKYPSRFYGRQGCTIEVLANSKREANANARRDLEAQSMTFDKDDAATFRAAEIVT